MIWVFQIASQRFVGFPALPTSRHASQLLQVQNGLLERPKLDSPSTEVPHRSTLWLENQPAQLRTGKSGQLRRHRGMWPRLCSAGQIPSGARKSHTADHVLGATLARLERKTR